MDESRDEDFAAGRTRARGRYMLAGMALRNGVLVIGPTHWSATVRTSDGSLRNAVRRKPVFASKVQGLPGVRGAARLAEMLAVLPAVRLALPEARLPMESGVMAGTSIASSVAMRSLRRRYGPTLAVDLVGSAVSLGLLLASVRGGELACYHGAEHKAIGGYEQSIPAAEATREHARCGTHLAVPMLAINAIATEGARLVLPRSPQAAALAGAMVGVAASTELMRRMQRGDDSRISRAAHSLGMRLQTMASTREPDASQLAVAEHALTQLLQAEDRQHAHRAA